MELSELAARAVQPWLVAVADFESWIADLRADPRARDVNVGELYHTARRLRDVFEAMAAGKEAIRHSVTPAEHAAMRRGENTPANLFAPDLAKAFYEEVQSKREAVLNFAIWRLVRDMTSEPARGEVDALEHLLASLAVHAGQLPICLAPSLKYAASKAGMDFVNGYVCEALKRLAGNHSEAAPALMALSSVDAFDGSADGLARWAPIFAVASATAYLNWLIARSRDNKSRPALEIWRTGSTLGFNPGQGLAVLHTGQHGMHVDLRTEVVLAQALLDDPSRWALERDGPRLHRVHVSIHRLVGKDEHVGLSLEMVYQAALFSLAEALPDRPTWQGSAMISHSPGDPTNLPEATVEVELPNLGKSHKAMLKILLLWPSGSRRGPSEGDRSRRLLRSTADQPIQMDAKKRQLFADWLHTRGEAVLQIPVSSLAWSAPAGQRALDEGGGVLESLGHVALWSVLGADVSWVDLAVVARWAGTWHPLPIRIHDTIIDGRSRSWLLLRPTTAHPEPIQVHLLQRALASERASAWAVQRSGVGAFMLGALFADEAD